MSRTLLYTPSKVCANCLNGAHSICSGCSCNHKDTPWWGQESDLSLEVLEKDRLKWSLETFTDATAISSLRKCESEIKEIENDLVKGRPDPEEYADAIMCLLDSAGRAGLSVRSIIVAYADKTRINKGRKWKKNHDNSYSHIKPEEEQR